MTAVLAAIARLVLTAVLGAVLLAAAVSWLLYAWAGPQGWPLVAWLLAVCMLIVGAAAGMSALQPEGDERHGQR